MTETPNKGQPARRRRRRGRARSGPKGSANRPVPLFKRCIAHFRPGDRQRGADYFHDGRVKVAIADTRARGRVDGSERLAYLVGVDWSKVGPARVLHVFCECPRFAKGKPCKHVWATLLALGETGPENQPPGKDRLGLRKDRPESWVDLTAVSESLMTTILPPKGSRRAPNQAKTRSRGRRSKKNGAAPTWRSLFAQVREQVLDLIELDDKRTEPQRDQIDFQFLINTRASTHGDGLVLDVFGRRPSGRGPGRLKRVGIDPQLLEKMLLGESDSADDEPKAEASNGNGAGVLAIVTGMPVEPPNRQQRGSGDSGKGHRGKQHKGLQRFRVPPPLFGIVLPNLCATGSLASWDGRRLGQPKPLQWDDGEPWRLALRLDANGGGVTKVRGSLERNGDRAALKDAFLILSQAGHEKGQPSLALHNGTIAMLEAGGRKSAPWIQMLREGEEIVIPRAELEDALTALLELPGLPPLEAPEELQLEEERSTLRPQLLLDKDPAATWADAPLLAELSFHYGELEISAADPRPAVVDWDERKFLRRDLEAEHKALVRLLELGVEPVKSAQGHELELDPTLLPVVAEPLLSDGWSVQVRGSSLRPPSPPSMRVESGMDWFELSGGLDFEGDEIELKQILAAVKRGDRFIELEDGSKGLLPASMVETYDSLAQLAHDSTDDGLRFLPSQALLVDALLTAMPPTDVDRAFSELRLKLRSFERIKPKKEARGFQGTLRGYQREGLGWLGFLREFGLGGVLADDMGLGKTVQVLALLRANRTPSKTTGLPSLVVAPRSLVYNWIEEAERFTPTLSVVEYAGPDREKIQPKINDYDIVVTTYGTLRRDIGYLATVEFDTVVLDEAQAIKNRESQAAKASRLLNGRHRLALTGTPIENHIGELGSLFEFLNPGLLGRLPGLDGLSSGRAASQGELKLVAEGIRPFILRRTKAEVLADLPPKTEQVLHCDLRPRQRELYDKLRASYQASLLNQVESEGVGRSTMQVLEALLRLRQVACHPGLVNDEWADAGSAKLEALFEQVFEVLAEGHKAIIFSQFTKLLAFVREKLDERGSNYSYLDGQTRDRASVVERFQTDPDCNLFLISLKAGGTGLNLTAAGYVFLLDPWWNPAVEAQAIDRAHRIGQTQPVFAYRLIARDTVEEKILQLQSSKRQIADSILEGEGQSLKDLTADDLRVLLS